MKKWILFTLPAFLLGCSSFEEEFPPQDMTASRTLSSVVAEEPVQDPYSLDIMRQAVDSVALKTRGRAARIAGSQIQPTHRYVRFSPTTEDQFNALFDQSEFDCYNFRLDETSTVTEEEGYRFSPASDTPEELYAVMRTTVVLPDTIAWELLKEFYDPAVAPEGEANPAWADQVVAQARGQVAPRIVDGLPPAGAFWVPAGKIMAWDNIAGRYIPLEGVKVTIATPSEVLFATIATTKADGTFTSGRTLPAGAKASYSLSWDTEHWTLKNEANTSARLQGPALAGAWNLKIASNDRIPLGFATVYRAAFRYWCKMPTRGLTPPNFGRKVRFLCHDSSSFTYYWKGVKLTAGGLFHPTINSDADPDIEIGCAIPVSYLLGRAAHEIGHAAYYSYNPQFSNKTNALIQESWAEFATYIVIETEYQDMGVQLHSSSVFNPNQQMVVFENPDYYNMQEWVLIQNDEGKRLYTPMFIDVYDMFNQYGWYSYWNPIRSANLLALTPDDDLCIHNIREIQEMAFGSKNKSEAIGWIRSYASRYGFTSQQINRFWSVYSKIEDETYDRYK